MPRHIKSFKDSLVIIILKSEFGDTDAETPPSKSCIPQSTVYSCSAGASYFGVVRPLPKGVNRGVKRRSVRAKRGKIFSPSFFSCLDGLSWHLRALHCTVTAFYVIRDVWNGDNARFARITSRRPRGIPIAHAY